MLSAGPYSFSKGIRKHSDSDMAQYKKRLKVKEGSGMMLSAAQCRVDKTRHCEQVQAM